LHWGESMNRHNGKTKDIRKKDDKIDAQ